MKKQLMFLLFTMVMLTGLLSLASGQQILPKTKTNLMNAQNPGQDKILTMLQAQQEFLHLMKARTEALGQHAEIQAQIKNYAPAEKIRTFLQGPTWKRSGPFNNVLVRIIHRDFQDWNQRLSTRLN